MSRTQLRRGFTLTQAGGTDRLTVERTGQASHLLPSPINSAEQSRKEVPVIVFEDHTAIQTPRQVTTRNGPMPKYESEHYEIYVSKYRVEARTEAEAIHNLFDGENEPVDDSLEYLETAEDIGLPVDEYRELAEKLRALGVSVGDDVIPSIRSIQQVE
jgi:hypothetical protein